MVEEVWIENSDYGDWMVEFIPCKKGQYLKFKNLENKTLSWKSYDHDGTLWFEAIFELPSVDIIKSSKIIVAKKLKALLNLAKKEKTMVIGSRFKGDGSNAITLQFFFLAA